MSEWNGIRRRGCEHRVSGVLRLLHALTAGQTDLDLDVLDASVVEHALERGLGPVLAHVTSASGPSSTNACASRIRAANLTARVLTAVKYDVIADVLSAADSIGCRVGLLKGTATAVRYYPAPHLRTMGDIDLLVTTDRQLEFEALLRGLGFRQTSNQPPAAFVGRHHSMPFWHPERHVWIDVHTALYPRQYPLAQAAMFSPDAIWAQLAPIDIAGGAGYVMPHELQLVFSSARWVERFDADRGVYPLLDVSLLIHRHGSALDWDCMLATVDRSWAATALRVMLGYLCRRALAPVPSSVLTALAARDRHAGRVSVALLHRLADAAIDGHTPFCASLSWSALTRPASPTANLLAVPRHLAFPPGTPRRFSPVYAFQRLWRLGRRLVLDTLSKRAYR